MGTGRFARACAALAALSFALVLAAPTTCAGASPSNEPSPHKIDGMLGPRESRWPLADCATGEYVERGSNQTVPKLKLVLESLVVAGPVVVHTTVPNEFGSRAVTSMRIFVHNIDLFGDQDREYHITYWCTSNKDRAWLVFG